MRQLKADFKDWLTKQRLSDEKTKYKPKTIDDYISRINKISGRNWEHLSENLLPALAKYYEYSNKEYYLDRITVWYALNYFDKILKFINPINNINKANNQTIKLYIFHNKRDYYLTSISLNQLYDYTKLFNLFVFEQGNSSNELEYAKRDDFIQIIRDVVRKNKIESPRNVAFHIVYEQKSIPQEKTALSQYCRFISSRHTIPKYDYKDNNVMQLIANKNPNIIIGDRYEETRPITGMYSMQIEAKNENMRFNPDCTLTIKDLAKILDIDEDTVKKAFERFYFDCDNTELRKYYSVVSTNKYLEKYYHFVKSNKPANCYTLKGYEHWCKGRKACNILGIGKTAFYFNELNKKYTHIEYAENSPKYYEPDLK